MLLPGAVPTEQASLLGKPTWHTATIQPTGDPARGVGPSRYPGSIQVHLSHTATKANQVLQKFVRPFLGRVGEQADFAAIPQHSSSCGAGLRARPCRSSRARPAGKRQGQPQPHPVPIPRRERGSGSGRPQLSRTGSPWLRGRPKLSSCSFLGCTGWGENRNRKSIIHPFITPFQNARIPALPRVTGGGAAH